MAAARLPEHRKKQSMSRTPNEHPPSDDFDAEFEEFTRLAEAEAAKGGSAAVGGPGSGSGFGAAGAAGYRAPGARGVGRHWAVAGLTLVVALAVTAALGIYVNLVVALIGGLVLFAAVMVVAIRTGYRAGLPADKAADIPLGLGAALAVLSLAYFAPVFYLSSAGKEGVTTDVFSVHGSRGSITCTAVLPNGKTSRVTCLDPGDKNRLSAGHYRVVYDPDGTIWARSGTKADLPVALGALLVGAGVAAFAVGAGLGVARAGRGRSGWQPATAAG